MAHPLEDSFNSSEASDESEFSLISADSGASDDDNLVYLSVGGQTFVTLEETLRESEYLRQLTSRSTDERCFVDGDPELFKHILRYLRHGQFPLFYKENSGFDYGKYHNLLNESKRLKIQKLANWIEREEFKKLVKIHLRSFTLKHVDPDRLYLPSYIYEPYSVQIFSLMERRYNCPRKIPVHKEPWDCGRKCWKVKACTRDDGSEYTNVPYHNAYVTEKSITIDRKAMIARK
uniref:ARAD1C15884p n=1 Tax=Blastobotrys adeninivorans TaxID=409370 RepID=A0A060T6R6_BLAAD